MKKKLLFVGHEYHQKTKSHSFMADILEKYYDITYVYMSPNQKNVNQILEKYSEEFYDVLLCWQIFPPAKMIKKYLNFKHCVLFPMYDNVKNKTPKFWLQYRIFNIINFSKTLHEDLKSKGYSSYYIQYFPEPKEVSDFGDEKSIFFWQRLTQLNIKTLSKVIDFDSINHIHIHKALDPQHTFTEPDENLKNKISYSTWYDNKADMQKDIEKYAIYIAPRMYEGIGMSFLEAMAAGRCVIAVNNPTMNEYITNNVNGILYDLNNPQKVTLKNIRKLQVNADTYIQKGYKKWSKDKFNILNWIETKPKYNNFKIFKNFTLFKIKDFYSKIKIILIIYKSQIY